MTENVIKQKTTDAPSIHNSLKQFAVLLLVLAMFFGIAYGVSERKTDFVSVKDYATSDVKYTNGAAKHSNSNYFGAVNRGDIVDVHVVLPLDLKIADSALCFAIYHCVVEVWYGDALIYSAGKEVYARGDMLGNSHHAIPIPDEAWGNDLTLRLTATEDNAFARINTLKVYPKITAFHYFIDADPIGFFVSVPLLFVSMILLILLCILGRKNQLFHKGICILLFILFVSLSIYTSDGFERFMGFQSDVWTQIEFMMVFIVSYPFLEYVRVSLSNGIFRKICSLVLAFDIAFFSVATVLNFTNTLHYCVLLPYSHLLTAINALIVLVFSLLMHNAGSRSTRLLYDGITLLVACTLIELLRTNITALVKLNIPSIVHLGLATLIICLLMSYVSEILEVKQAAEELRKELDESRIRILINQMQPHFLYNALSSIRTMIKVQPDYAYDLMHDFTVHLRSSIQALSSNSPIPFTDELKNVKSYLNIEQMRFGKKLRVVYEIGCEDFEVIPLAVQPLIENSVKHGIHPKGDKGGTVILRTFQTYDNYIIEVEDNGVGFDINDAMQHAHDSVGLENLIFRMESLMSAKVIVCSEIACGTKVTIEIPKRRDKK